MTTKPEIFFYVTAYEQKSVLCDGPTFYISAEICHFNSHDGHVQRGHEYEWSSLNNGEIDDFKLQMHYHRDTKCMYSGLHETYAGRFYNEMHSPSISEMEAKVKFAKKLVKKLESEFQTYGYPDTFAKYLFEVSRAIGDCPVAIFDPDNTGWGMKVKRFITSVDGFNYWIEKQIKDQYGEDALVPKENV